MLDTKEKQIKSKSQIKRDLLALQDLGRDLLKLPDKVLPKVPLSDSVLEAIQEARQMKKVALKRQLKHIGALMRDEDEDAIRVALVRLRQPHLKEVKEFHEVEVWRDGLLAGDDSLLDELGQRFPAIDHQHLRQLVRNAKKEQTMNKPLKSAKALFRYLKEISRVNAGPRV
jgi:ribosome-associated protein